MKRQIRKKLTKPLLAITDGVLGTVTDFTLLLVFSLLSSAKPGRGTIYDALYNDEALRWHDEVNYQTIKSALYQLTTKGLIKRLKKRDMVELAITKQGKQRLAALVPTYSTSRLWDGHLYLISYDIPATKNSARNLLRTYIRKTGGALLQDSLWINPYNPSTLLSEFVQARNIPGTILISKLGKDGAIGEERTEDLLRRVYHLDELADRYDAFLEKFSPKTVSSSLAVFVAYAAILKDDPQLPFPLLPKDFPAAEAYELFRCQFPGVSL